MDDERGTVDIALPRRLDRRMRLGPFPSARDAMKFAAYAAVGTAVLPAGGAAAWLPFVAGGFLLSVYRPDGKALDERAGDYVRWLARRSAARRTRTGRELCRTADRFVRLPGPFLATIVQAGGVPTRFLPPSDSRALFEQYRETLRSVGTGVLIDAGVTAFPPGSFALAGDTSLEPAEILARNGYAEMVRLLLRRRSRRRVRVGLFAPLGAASSVRRLEEETDSLLGHLSGIGVEAQRLVGAEMRRAAGQAGWTGGGS